MTINLDFSPAAFLKCRDTGLQGESVENTDMQTCSDRDYEPQQLDSGSNKSDGCNACGALLDDDVKAKEIAEQMLGLDTLQVIEAVSSEALKQEGCPYEVQLDVYITDDDEIHGINLEERGIDRPTDVLSFPNLDFAAPGDFSLCEDSSMSADCFDPDSGELVLGSIVLSVTHILAQAREYGHSVKREFAFLTAHSMFHLMGYDHMTAEDEHVMKAKQYAVLDALGITR